VICRDGGFQSVSCSSCTSDGGRSTCRP
jgi:hypothetical protein